MMMDWENLQKACSQCTRCGLCETRHNVVFGVGRRDADILFVGEGPGEQEDLRGSSVSTLKATPRGTKNYPLS